MLTIMGGMCLLFLWLLFATVADSYTPCILCIDEASPAQLAAMKIRLYTGSTVDDYTSVLIGDALDLLDYMDNSKPTALYTFGWLGSPDQDITQVIVSAYVSQGDYNFLLLNWENIADNEYSFAARSVEGVGCTLAMSLNDLVAGGLNITGMRLVGHSLGAQISGFAGRHVNFTLSQIIGLDPAAPGFYIVTDHLASGDAEFVTIVHTNFGQLGINLDTGDANFYFNNGFNQPTCSILDMSCSHYLAVNYYADSVRYHQSFIGVLCDSYEDFKAGSCSSNAKAIMGDNTRTNKSGRYYLETNSQSPYGRGENGTICEESSESLLEEISDALTDLVA